jgi:hypothetical protein
MVKPVADDVGVNPLIEVAEATPRFGVTSVGEVLITTFPVPVKALETTFLLASVNNACEAVVLERTGAAVKVATPVTTKVPPPDFDNASP